MAKPDKQPPEEITGTAGTWRILVAVLGTLLTTLLVNVSAIWYINNNPENLSEVLIKKKWEMVLDMEHPADWLILGDSSGNQGVVPDIFNKRFGGTSINMCTVGTLLALNDAWILDTYIQRLGPPRNVLIVHVYDIWQRDLNYYHMAKVPLEWHYWERLKPTLELDLHSTWSIFLTRYIPLYSHDRTLSRKIKHPWAGSRSYSQIQDDGFMARSEPNPVRVLEDAEKHKSFLKDNEFNLSALNRAALTQIIELAERYKFNVYLANGPVYEGLYETEDFRTYIASVREALGTFAASSEWLHYILQVPATFPADQMQNVDHLVYSAALVYTDELVSEIISLEKPAPRN